MDTGVLTYEPVGILLITIVVGSRSNYLMKLLFLAFAIGILSNLSM